MAGLAHAASLRANPRFVTAAHVLADGLVTAFAGRPIPIRFAGAGARFITIAAFLCLHYQRNPEDDIDGATLSRIIDRIQHLGQVSRNTIASQMTELHKYGWVDHIQPKSDRRLRLLVPTADLQVEFEKWMFSFLGALDALDAGTRVMTAASRPELLIEIVKLGTDVLLGDSPWTNPAPEIGTLYWRDGGYLLLLALISAAAHAPEPLAGTSRFPMRGLDVEKIAADAFVSSRHVRDMTSRARQADDLDLAGTRRGNVASMSEAFHGQLMDWVAQQLALFDLVTIMAMARVAR